MLEWTVYMIFPSFLKLLSIQRICHQWLNVKSNPLGLTSLMIKPSRERWNASFVSSCVEPQNRDQPGVGLSWKLVPCFSMRMSEIRHFDAILTPSWQVPPALLTFKRHLPVTKADVLYLCTKKAGGKNCRENLPGWRIDGDDEMREANGEACARRHARGDMREAT